VGTSRSRTGPYVSEKDFSQTYETVDWSRARDGHDGFIALDGTPAPAAVYPEKRGQLPENSGLGLGALMMVPP
jgi:hypothetical protein